ncbi:hypothetical protein BH23VER1_BH23VER1_19660 [soil metagenome]
MCNLQKCFVGEVGRERSQQGPLGVQQRKLLESPPDFFSFWPFQIVKLRAHCIKYLELNLVIQTLPETWQIRIKGVRDTLTLEYMLPYGFPRLGQTIESHEQPISLNFVYRSQSLDLGRRSTVHYRHDKDEN